MRRDKEDWFMFALVLPAALLGALFIYIGAKDSESRRQQEHAVLSVTIVVTDTIPTRNDYRTVQPRLETLEDSIHEFEDGF